MSRTVLADRAPNTVSWQINDPELADTAPAQMAACLAGAAAASPITDKIKSFEAAHTSGAVITVYRGADGRFDPEAPVFTVTRIAVAS